MVKRRGLLRNFRAHKMHDVEELFLQAQSQWYGIAGKKLI